eukprot:COSAG06_NODE_91_length_24730_cov_26.482603_19_plen_76_part_00
MKAVICQDRLGITTQESETETAFPAAYPPGCTMANLSGCVPATSFTAEPNRTYYDWSLTPMGTPVRTTKTLSFPR